MKPKILNDITNIFAKLSGSKDYDPRVKYDTALEYYANQVPVVPKPTIDDNGKAIVAGTDSEYKLESVELEKLAVNITVDDHEHYSADKTLAELNAAYSAGKKIEFHFYNYVLPVVYSQNNNYQASIPSISDTGAPAGVISIFYNAFGVYLVVDGPFEREIRVTLHTDMTFSFSSIEALNAVQLGTPFKMAITTNNTTRYLLCQLNGVMTTYTYKATLIDGFVIYTAQVTFDGATAIIYSDEGGAVSSIEELRQISVEPGANYDGRNMVYWGYDYDGNLRYQEPPNFTLSVIPDSPVTSQFITLIGALKTAAMSASDKKASGYIYVDDTATSLLNGTSQMLSKSRQEIFRLGSYFLSFDGFVLDNTGENNKAATFRAIDVNEPSTIGTDPVVIYKIRFTVTFSGLAVLEVEANSVPALPVQP